MTILRIRKLADRSTETRVKRYDQHTGVPRLINPATPGSEHEPWPLAGIQLIDGAPQETSMSTKFVQDGIEQGWIVGEGENVVHAPGGPPSAMWRVTHTFTQYDYITIKTVDGDVRYRVTKNPGKDDNGVTWYYQLELVGA